MPSGLRSIRIAIRSLLGTPTVTAAAVVSLGLGLGATTAVFSAVSAALLEGLPFPQPERLVSVFRTTPHFVNGPFAPGNFYDLRRETETLSDLGAIATGGALLRRTEGTEQVSVNRVSGEVFPMLGASPLLGRLLTPADERPDAPPAAVIGGELFRNQLGADPDVIGSTITLDGEPATVVGVLPEDFRIPHRTRNITADVWLAYRPDPEHAQYRRYNYLLLVGRLAPGASVRAAETELVALHEGLAETYPEIRGESVRVGSMWEESSGPIRGPLLLMLGAVAMVLLIAVVNVTGLMLARGARRRRELALRTALGAGRWQIVRGVLLETAVLAGAGIGVGLLVAWAGVKVIGQLGMRLYPQLEGLGFDLRVLAFALGATVLAALLAGVLPGWRIAGTDPQEALRAGGARAGIGRTQNRLLRGLVVAELALSAVLLIGAGLLLHAFLGLMNRDPGFDPEGMLTMVVQVSPDGYGDVPPSHGFLQPALERLRSVPGVEEAAYISHIPYVNWGTNFNIRYEGVEGGEETQLPLTESRVVSPASFAVFGQELLRGRLFEPAENTLEEDVPQTVVVNEALVRRDFPNEDPIGKRYHSGDDFTTIVGVVSDIRNAGPISEPRPEVYYNIYNGGSSRTAYSLVMRVEGDPAARAADVSAALREVDTGVAISRVRPMEGVIADSLRRQRFYMILLGSFAAVAVVLAVTGLYGVISYVVAQRTREIGIRAALGATSTRTLKLVLTDAATLAAVGLGVGAVAGFGLTRLLETMLYGVSPLSVPVWAVALTGLFGTALAASLLPARRAARVDPLEAIRYE